MAFLSPGVRVNGVSCLDNCPKVRWVAFTIQPEGTSWRTEEPNELPGKQIGKSERGTVEVENNAV